MRRLVPAAAVCGGALAALCMTVAVARPAPSGRSAARIVGWQRVDADWFALEVGPRERSVVLGYVSGCAERGLRAHVRETARSVTIHVRGETAITVPANAPTSCPPGRRHRLRVALAQPLAGRPIRGRPAGEGNVSFASRERVAVPLLVGFSPADAERALAVAGLRAHVAPVLRRPGRRRVIGQSPRPRAEALGHSLITLTVAGR
jgi:hypothetical protein